MTAPRRDGSDQSPFHAWIRNVPDLDSRDYCISVTDNDCWVHQFAPRKERGPTVKQVIENLLLIEIKAFGAVSPFAQKDTLDVVDRLLRTNTGTRDGRRLARRIDDSRPGRPGCYRRVRWYGAHILQMSADRPDTSDRLLWDGKEIDVQSLIELLGFRRDPDKPSRFVDTRRHHLRPARETHPLLFERELA